MYELQVITHTGTSEYSKQDLQEMIDEIDMYYCADNLPKWLMASGHCKFDKKAVVKKLKELIGNMNQIIDVKY